VTQLAWLNDLINNSLKDEISDYTIDVVNLIALGDLLKIERWV